MVENYAKIGETMEHMALRALAVSIKGPIGYESDDDGGGSSFGGGSCGFTASECEQLQEQFVKPWDTDARAVLNALRY